jgi:hypothetical protein
MPFQRQKTRIIDRVVVDGYTLQGPEKIKIDCRRTAGANREFAAFGEEIGLGCRIGNKDERIIGELGSVSNSRQTKPFGRRPVLNAPSQSYQESDLARNIRREQSSQTDGQSMIHTRVDNYRG